MEVYHEKFGTGTILKSTEQFDEAGLRCLPRFGLSYLDGSARVVGLGRYYLLEVVELYSACLSTYSQYGVIPTDVHAPNSFELEGLNDLKGIPFDYIKDHYLSILISSYEMVP